MGDSIVCVWLKDDRLPSALPGYHSDGQRRRNMYKATTDQYRYPVGNFINVKILPLVSNARKCEEVNSRVCMCQSPR